MSKDFPGYDPYFNVVLVIDDATREYELPGQSMLGRETTIGGGGTAGYINVWTGSAWALKPVKVWNGSAWVIKPVKFWNGSAWVVA